MMKDEQEIHDAWMNDETGTIDLCQFCINNLNHPIGSVCTNFKYNGKTLKEVYPKLNS